METSQGQLGFQIWQEWFTLRDHLEPHAWATSFSVVIQPEVAQLKLLLLITDVDFRHFVCINPKESFQFNSALMCFAVSSAALRNVCRVESISGRHAGSILNTVIHFN